MTDYLSYRFEDSPQSVDTFDELPLWSAPFGLLLLRHLELRPGLTVLDLGSGAGFPLLELAGRLGPSCTLFGIDPWKNANARARKKVDNYGLSNVSILDGSAEQLPFGENSVDLIVSNLGINNFENAGAVFHECRRVLKPGGRLALTTNLDGHWKTFYEIFEQTLVRQGHPELVEGLHRHQAHRGSVESVGRLFSDNGLSVRRAIEDQFEMRFLDGSAFLRHYFVKLGWLDGWKTLLPEALWQPVFAALEANLNEYAARRGELNLGVPMVFVEAEKALS